MRRVITFYLYVIILHIFVIHIKCLITNINVQTMKKEGDVKTQFFINY